MKIALTLSAITLGLATLVAVPAFADENGQKHFPMPAAEFKAKVDHHMSKARARMEEQASKADAATAKDMRAKFDTAMANVNAEVAKACADGTVTADEAKAVRAANPYRGKHARRHKKST